MEFDPAVLEGVAQRFRGDMWQAVCEDAVIECGIEERWFGPVQVTQIETLPYSPLFNNVLGAAEPGAVEDGYLEAALEWADSSGVDYRVAVARERPGMAVAEAWLDRHGFEQSCGLVKYVRDTSMPHLPGVPGLRVWDITGNEHGPETMIFEAADALGLPDDAASLICALPTIEDRWRTFTVEMDGDIVSFGSMLLHDGVAQLGLDATVAKARGRGCNQALLRERILVAAAEGCRTLVAELDEQEPGAAVAARNLLRAGFVPAYRSMNWRRPRG
jgi:GNAT superfamily N-acetyltransferase